MEIPFELLLYADSCHFRHENLSRPLSNRKFIAQRARMQSSESWNSRRQSRGLPANREIRTLSRPPRPKSQASYQSRFPGTKRFRTMLDRSVMVGANIRGEQLSAPRDRAHLGMYYATVSRHLKQRANRKCVIARPTQNPVLQPEKPLLISLVIRSNRKSPHSSDSCGGLPVPW